MLAPVRLIAFWFLHCNYEYLGGFFFFPSKIKCRFLRKDGRFNSFRPESQTVRERTLGTDEKLGV